jgi:hypothetical protein
MTDTDTQEVETETKEAALPPEQEDRIVDKVVNKLKEIVLAPAALVEDDPEDETEVVTKEPTTVKEIETDMEAQVRAQLKKIGAEEEHAKEHEKLKTEPERPPVQVGRVTRALWGAG